MNFRRDGLDKDQFDLYTLIAHHRPIEELFPLYQQKFSVTDISPVLYVAQKSFESYSLLPRLGNCVRIDQTGQLSR